MICKCDNNMKKSKNTVLVVNCKIKYSNVTDYDNLLAGTVYKCDNCGVSYYHNELTDYYMAESGIIRKSGFFLDLDNDDLLSDTVLENKKFVEELFIYYLNYLSSDSYYFYRLQGTLYGDYMKQSSDYNERLRDWIYFNSKD